MLCKSENGLVEKAVSLQLDLEKSVQDITGLHLKIDRKGNVETQNQRLVQDFHSKLGHNLENVRNIVVSSVTQQQQQFLDMEKQLKSFMATKEEVSEGLRKKLSSLNNLYCLGFKGLNDMVEAHDQESLTTFKKVNLAVSDHSLALEGLLSAAVSEAELLLKDLHTALQDQESEITRFTHQLQQGALQSIEASRAISDVTMEFFLNLEKNTTQFCQSLYQSHQTQQECLNKLEETYQDCSRREEEQLLNKIAEMLAATMARKSELVSSKLKHLRDTGAKDYNEMEQGMLDMHATSSKARVKWEGFMSQAEADHAEHSVGLTAKNAQLQKIIQECSTGTKAMGDKWRGTQESLKELERNNLVEVEYIVKEGMCTNELMLANLRESNVSIGLSIEDHYTQFLESIEGSVTHDRDAGAAALSSCSVLSMALTELQTSHRLSTQNIDSLADKCFNHQYMEDAPTCMTPRKRDIEVPSQASIDALRAPELEMMCAEFQEANQVLLCEKDGEQNIPARETKIPIFADSSLLRDGRLPLTAMN